MQGTTFFSYHQKKLSTFYPHTLLTNVDK